MSTLGQSELDSSQVETEVLKLGQILPVDLTSFLSRQNKDMIIIYLEKDIRSQHGHVPRRKYVFDLFFFFFPNNIDRPLDNSTFPFFVQF